MSEKITLYYKESNSEALACLIALEAVGYEVEFLRVDQKALFGKDLKAINPSSLTPFAHSNSVTYLQASAILRLVGRKNQELYGKDILAKAKVDSMVDRMLNVYSSHIDQIMDSVYDRLATKVDFRKVDESIQRLIDFTQFLEKELKDAKFAVGDSLTIADIAFACVFEPYIRFICNSKQRATLKNCTKLLSSLIDNTILKRYFRPLSGLKEEVFPILRIDVEEQERIALKEKLQREEEERKMKELEEEEKLKMQDPVLPESKLPFDDWKNYVCSEKDAEKKADYILQNWEEEAYSFWQLDYDKYPGSFVDLLPSSNQYVFFMGSCEVFRKWIYAIHLLTGDQGDYSMKGLWMMRGTEKLSNFNLIDDMEYYFYKKLDPKKEEDWKVIKEFLALSKESVDRDTIQGKMVRGYTSIA